jgi:hypothetical protein
LLPSRRQPRVIWFAVLELVRPLDEVLSLLPRRHAEQVEEDLVRQRPRQCLGDVDLTLVAPWLYQATHYLADLILQLGDAARQEMPLHQLAELVVTRIVDVWQEAWPALILGGVIDVNTLEAAERFCIQRRRPHIFEPGKRPEPPLLTLIDRGFVPHPLVEGERIRLELHRERIVPHVLIGVIFFVAWRSSYP